MKIKKHAEAQYSWNISVDCGDTFLHTGPFGWWWWYDICYIQFNFVITCTAIIVISAP